MSDMDNDRLMGLARVLTAFRDMSPQSYIAAVATADGGTTGVTYGDLLAIMQDLTDVRIRILRIALWHGRETGPGGTVGDLCTECGNRWPCNTRLMADGTYIEER